MQEYDRIREDIILYFLTEFSVSSPVKYVEVAVRDYLSRTYSEEWIDNFWAVVGESVVGDLVDEFNRRLKEGFPISYTFLDDDSTKIRGWNNEAFEFDINAFQKALLQLTPDEFEKLCARVLQIIGCNDVWATPASHDQGIDAFGRIALFNPPERIPSFAKTRVANDEPSVWIVLQAKHYTKEKVRSSEIRELAGATYLAKYGLYAQASAKYEQLELKPLAPIAIVLMTSGETKRTVRILSEKSGIALLNSSDLCAIFSVYWAATEISAPNSPEELSDRFRTELDKVIIAH